VRSCWLAAPAALAALACAPHAPTGADRFEPGWPLLERARPVLAPTAAVSSNSYLASAAGVAILRRGGNAVDAAVATGFALAVTHPEAGSIGGGGFMVIRLLQGGPPTRNPQPAYPVLAALDFRETAPGAATRDMFASPGDTSVSSSAGPRAVSVPGSVAGLTEALARYGTLPLDAVLAPAIRLAEEGFVVDSLLARSIRQYRATILRGHGRDLLLPDGLPLNEGDTLRQPALARTLRRIVAGGAEAFYHGAIAREIAAEVRGGGGILSAADLANYRVHWREPVTASYRGYILAGAPLPSSGVLTAGHALMILESAGPPAPFGSVRALHNTASALQRAFIDRARLGDPDGTPASAVAAMRDRDRAGRIARTIDPARATRTSVIVESRAREPMETTHWSVVDAWGNAVAATTTINDIYGSGVFVRTAGIFLSDTMDDFAATPGTPDQWGLVSGEANAIVPGRRPLSSMTPVLLFDRDQRLVLIAGARGGPRIISVMLQMVTNIVDHRMSVSEAISAPRIHHQASPDMLRYEAGGFRPAVLDSLRALGWELSPQTPDAPPYIGRAVAIGRAANGWEAVVDPRFGELSAGY